MERERGGVGGRERDRERERESVCVIVRESQRGVGGSQGAQREAGWVSGWGKGPHKVRSMLAHTCAHVRPRTLRARTPEHPPKFGGSNEGGTRAGVLDGGGADRQSRYLVAAPISDPS